MRYVFRRHLFLLIGLLRLCLFYLVAALGGAGEAGLADALAGPVFGQSLSALQHIDTYQAILKSGLEVANNPSMASRSFSSRSPTRRIPTTAARASSR